ncbi:hypothetical protein Xen7305DRAFT_00035750 [Xenococcus sp. PCC 7305]|uniref:GAF domain-containing protein n=1 Tax=Xenococcus sp. PCC 7305 TaxID=102125 RepID=UPI0002ABEA0B|nr:GAF domain-containing protein [Xenococcus sp. PCC 7305]ELS03851.1 hypothetical protein Xen7305DRAFT_00035750 [Xenococcus sp. PCC 7305]
MNEQKLNEFFKKSDAREIATWIRRGLKDKNFYPLILSNQTTTTRQLKYIFKYLEANQQEKFKNAFALLASELNLKEFDDINILKDVAITIAYLGADQAIESLISIIDDKRLGYELDKNNIDYDDITQTIFAVLSGFMPSEKIKILFENLLFEKFDSQFAAQLLIGLCKNQPNNYAHYLNRFFQIEKEDPKLFKLKFILPIMEDTVTESIVGKNFYKLNSYSRERLISFLPKYIRYTSKNSFEDLSIIKKILQGFEHKEEIIKVAISLIREKLNSQTTAIYLFSKEGKLKRHSIDGIDNQNILISNKWFENEIYDLCEDDNLIVKAARPQADGFGKPQFLQVSGEKDQNILNTFEEKYLEKLGSLNCGVAVPLDGKNKTYGVLVVINKVEPGTANSYPTCSFPDKDLAWLYTVSSSVSEAISNWRRNKQRILEKDLDEFLIRASFKEPKKVYQEIVSRLISENTSFKACVLRVKDKFGLLKVAGIDIVANTPEEKARLLEERKNESISPNKDSSHPGWASNNREPSIIMISENNINTFFINKNWVETNNFQSFACFPLISRGKVVGTLSLYAAYKYDFHPSCKAFLSRITSLVASFIRRISEDETVQEAVKVMETAYRNEPTKLQTVFKTTRKALASIVSEDPLHRYDKFD